MRKWESIVIKVDPIEKLEIQELIMRLGYESQRHFIVDVTRGISAVLDDNYKQSTYIYIPIPSVFFNKLKREAEKMNKSIYEYVYTLL